MVLSTQASPLKKLKYENLSPVTSGDFLIYMLTSNYMKTKTTKKVIDYKKAYEAEKKLNVNLSDLLDEVEDVSFERYGLINELSERLDNHNNVTFLISLATLIIGVLIGLYI